MKQTEERRTIRMMVNSFFEDVDNEAKIGTDLANIMCNQMTDKILGLLQANDDLWRKRVEKIIKGSKDQRYTYDNPYAESCRYELQEIQRQRLDTLLQDQEETIKPWERKCNECGIVVNMMTVHSHKDGNWFYIDSDGSPVSADSKKGN